MKKVFKYLSLFAVSGLVTLSAETVASEYSLFKRTISPAMNWGENGLMLVPKAQPIGKGDVNLGFTSLDSGKINGEKLYLTTGTLMIGTSQDVELGFSKRTFIWETGERSDIEMDTFHLKARIVNFTDFYTPQISVGVNGASLKSNEFSNNKDIIYNPYVAVTLPIKIVNEDYQFSITGVAEQVQTDGESSDAVFSAGLDFTFWKSLYLMAEAQGINQETEDPVYNVGAKFKYGWFSIGAGLFNISQDKIKDSEVGAEDNEEQYWMAHMNLEIPLGKLFGDEKKKAPPKYEASQYKEDKSKEEKKEENKVKSQFDSKAEFRSEQNKQFNELEGVK